MTKNIEDLPFSAKELQTFCTISKYIEKHDITYNMIVEFVEERKKQIAEGIKESSTKIIRKCPECGKTLSYRVVTEPKGRGNLNGYTWNWACFACGFDEYTYENVKSALKKYGKQGE